MINQTFNLRCAAFIPLSSISKLRHWGSILRIKGRFKAEITVLNESGSYEWIKFKNSANK